MIVDEYISISMKIGKMRKMLPYICMIKLYFGKLS